MSWRPETPYALGSKCWGFSAPSHILFLFLRLPSALNIQSFYTWARSMLLCIPCTHENFLFSSNVQSMKKKYRQLCVNHLSMFSSRFLVVAFWHYQSAREYFQHNCYYWNFNSLWKKPRLQGWKQNYTRNIWGKKKIEGDQHSLTGFANYYLAALQCLRSHRTVQNTQKDYYLPWNIPAKPRLLNPNSEQGSM